VATVRQPHRSPDVAARVNVRRGNRYARYGFAALVVTGVIYAGASVTLGHRHAIAASSNSAVAPTTDHAPVAPPKVLNAAVASSRRRRTQSVAAYELYVRGTDQSLYRSDSGTRSALHFLREAVALDSNYAAAWAQLGRAYARIGLVGTSTSERNRYYALADEAARKSVALDDSLAEAHTALASTRMASFDFISAERELRRAIELDPGRGETYEKLAWLYLWTGRTPDALAHARRSVELDSLSTTARGQLALVLLANDRCDEALAELDRILHVRPPLLRAAAVAAQCYARKERWPEAVAVLSAQAETGEPTALAQVAYMYARGGRRAEALRIRDGLLERWRRGVIGAYALAVVDAGLGDLDQAMTWLDRSISDRSLVATGTNPAHVMLMGPLLEDLRRHPGFERLRPRLGLARK
jgi:tetratricopeptide (TPR) repeat protein